MAEIDRAAPGKGARPRQQAGAIAIRRNGEHVEVCLIRKRATGKWGIPKGIIDPGETPEETALKEAWEEAGLEGWLKRPPLGTFRLEKWNTSFEVVVYLMTVHQEADEWPEKHLRRRRWMSFQEAAGRLVQHPAGPILALAGDLALSGL
jgi:8-oxo-dGTP pyrophosphatase MutT (NUDIX family)